ncbi:transporter [Bacteroidia bacterium]|nr:transporter [Bacteroidia bacterium]
MVALLGCGLVSARSQSVLTFAEYMRNVRECNVGYLAEKYNVDIAAASAKAARVMPDPELSVGYNNNQNWNLQMGYGWEVGLSYDLELGGKRRARMMLARSETELADALLEDYFRNLRADAAIAYLGALREQSLLGVQRASCLQMDSLARADSIRFRLGAISEVDARQSRLEAGTLQLELYSRRGDLQDALLQLLVMQGSREMTLPDSVAGSLGRFRRDLTLPALLASALDRRADLKAALKSQDISQSNLRLARANRAIDLGLNIGGVYSSQVRNDIAPAPAFKGITAGISVPLKFSGLNRGEVTAAGLSARQSDMQYEAAELQIRAEVTQAFNKYTLACSLVDHFDRGLLGEAAVILQKKIYSYRRGETGILEVLNARRTWNEVQTGYLETLFDCAGALVELQRAAAIWDIEL